MLVVLISLNLLWMISDLEWFTCILSFKMVVESSGLKLVHASLYFANEFIKSRIVFLWCSILTTCFSFLKASFWIWLRAIVLNWSNSYLLISQLHPSLFRTIQKLKQQRIVSLFNMISLHCSYISSTLWF